MKSPWHYYYQQQQQKNQEQQQQQQQCDSSSYCEDDNKDYKNDDGVLLFVVDVGESSSSSSSVERRRSPISSPESSRSNSSHNNSHNRFNVNGVSSSISSTSAATTTLGNYIDNNRRRRRSRRRRRVDCSIICSKSDHNTTTRIGMMKTLLFVSLFFTIVLCTRIDASPAEQEDAADLPKIIVVSSSDGNSNSVDGEETTITTTSTTTKMLEQMWKLMHGQITNVMHEMHHKHVVAAVQQSSTISTSSSTSSTSSSQNYPNERNDNSNAGQQQQHPQQQTTYNPNNPNNNNNIPLHQRGPGLHTYHRRKALYEHSLHGHFAHQLLLLNNTSTSSSTSSTSSNTASSSEDDTSPSSLQRINETIWNQIYALYLNHDSSGSCRSSTTRPNHVTTSTRNNKGTTSSGSTSSSSNSKNEAEDGEEEQAAIRRRKRQQQQQQKQRQQQQQQHRSRSRNDVDSRSSTLHTALPPFPNSFKKANRELIVQMFQHAYDNYMMHGWPASEVRPISCQPTTFALVKLKALTVIDALDSLIVINNNITEFARAVERLRYLHNNVEHLFHVNENVSVFETNIRVLGGLLSAHQLAIAYQLDRTNITIQQDNPYSVLITNVLYDNNNNNNNNNKQKNSSTNKYYYYFSNNNKNGHGTTNDAVKWGYDDFIPNFYQTKRHNNNNNNSNNNSNNKSRNKPRNSNNNNNHHEKTCSLEKDLNHATTTRATTCEVQETTTDAAHSTTKSDKSGAVGTSLDEYWIYDGFLLELAEDIGTRLLPAFEATKTGIPYGTINLIYGVPKGETKIASVAGGGTLTLEFELLSRLTGNPRFGNAAKLATRAIWMRRSKSPLNLMGKHIDIDKGLWTETLSGIGSNSDSFLEYLAKQYMLFPDDHDFWTMLTTAYQGVADHSRTGEWYVDTDMSTGVHGGSHRRVFESLAAFYPGLQVLLGELTPAARTLNSMFMVRELLGFLPERFNFGIWNLDALQRDQAGKHPLRPELLESCYFLHRATRSIIQKAGKRRGNSRTHADKDQEEENHEYTSSLLSLSSGWQWAADFSLHKLNHTTYSKCGYAGVERIAPQTTGVVDSSRSTTTAMDEMPSFFLSETLKYLYLTFDDDDQSIIHSDQDREWIFTTEAHPFHYVGRNHRQQNKENQEKKDQREPSQVSTRSGTIFRKEIDKLKKILGKKLQGQHQHRPNQQSRFQRRRSNKANYDNLIFEKWTENSSLRLYREGIERSNSHALYHRRKLFDSNKNNNVDSQNLIPLNDDASNMNYLNDFTQRSLWVAPFSGPQQIRDAFHETSSKVNLAHLAYENLSLGSDLRKACPNVYSSQLTWLQALNGGSIDYTDMFVSVTSDLLSEHPNSFITLGAAEALGSLGTGLYYGDHDDMGQSCPIVLTTIGSTSTATKAFGDNDSETKVPNTNSGVVFTEPANEDESSGSDSDDLDGINDSILVESDIGQFEVSEFHDGSGFFIRNVASDEKIVVNFVKGDSHRMMHQPHTQPRKIFDFATIYSHLRPVITDKNSDDNMNDLEKKVVIADFDGNVFSCQLEIIETIRNEKQEHKNDDVYEDLIIGVFPCAPAAFGPSHISRLAQTPGGIVLEASLIAPSKKHPTGCYDDVNDVDPEKVPNDDDRGWQASGYYDETNGDNVARTPIGSNSHEFNDASALTGTEIPVLFVEQPEEETYSSISKCCSTKASDCIHMVHRGTCTFYEKTINCMERLGSKGVIVINHVDDEIFLMANAGDNDELISKYDETHLPLSVLLTQQDGDSVLEMIEQKTTAVTQHGQLFTGSMPMSELDNNDCSPLAARISIKRQIASVVRETGVVVNEAGDSDPSSIMWPVVRANENGIQILTQFGWGIQAVAAVPSNTESGASSSRLIAWQLQLLKHNVTKAQEKSV